MTARARWNGSVQRTRRHAVEGATLGERAPLAAQPQPPHHTRPGANHASHAQQSGAWAVQDHPLHPRDQPCTSRTSSTALERTLEPRTAKTKNPDIYCWRATRGWAVKNYHPASGLAPLTADVLLSAPTRESPQRVLFPMQTTRGIFSGLVPSKIRAGDGPLWSYARDGACVRNACPRTVESAIAARGATQQQQGGRDEARTKCGSG